MTSIRARWRRYRKAIIAALGAVATAVASALTDGTITMGEWALVVVAVLTALGVYQVRNEPQGRRP